METGHRVWGAQKLLGNHDAIKMIRDDLGRLKSRMILSDGRSPIIIKVVLATRGGMPVPASSEINHTSIFSKGLLNVMSKLTRFLTVLI